MRWSCIWMKPKAWGSKFCSQILTPQISNLASLIGNILFGLQGIKNVGLAALEDIMAVRAKKTFTDLIDFCTRVDLRTVNKRVIESLICAGAFDALPGSRAQKYQDLAKIMETAAEKKKELQTGQISLFGNFSCNKHASTTEQSARTNFRPAQNGQTKKNLNVKKK